MANYQSRTRLQIAVDILRNVCGGEIVDGVATATVDTTSLQDTYGLYLGGTDHYKGRQVVIYEPTGTIVAGSKSHVASSVSTDCTCSPAFSANITTGDKYLVIPQGYNLENVNNIIGQMIQKVTGKVYNEKVTSTTYTERDRYQYDCLSGFTHLYRVEYVSSIDEYDDLPNSLWTGATSVTATSDTEFYRGHVCTKLNVDGAVAAAAQLGYVATGTLNLSNRDTVELWLRSSIAQTAANIELTLCSDTLGVTAVDTISLPAITIDKWTRLQLTMTNPELDTAICSIALKQKAATDIGACIIWVEYPKVINSVSRIYNELSPSQWSIVRGSTNYLKLSSSGKSVTGDDTLLRLSGYQIPTFLSADSTTADIDPAYLVAAGTAEMLINYYHGELDTEARMTRAQPYLAQADRLERQITTSYKTNTRLI